ncbi:hypothetical protein Tco_0904143 [Tanacetum coccineum]
MLGVGWSGRHEKVWHQRGCRWHGEEGKRDGNNPGANPLNSILKKTNSTSIPTMDGVDVVNTDYTRAFVDIKGDRALKDTMVISIPTIIGNGVMMHTIKGEMSNDGFQIVQRKVVRSPLVSEHEEGDNRKHMDELVADTRKKVKAPLRKTGIWSGRKAGSSLKSRLSSHNPFDLLTSKSLGNSAGENT